MLNGENKESRKADKFFQEGDYENAIEAYDAALENESDPGERATYRYRIGESYHRLNRPDKAEKFLKESIKQGFMSADAYLLLGDVQLKLGKTDDAQTSYEAYALANPNDRNVDLKLASVKFARDNRQNLSLFKLEEPKRINSRQNDFGVSYFNESLLFSSTRMSAEDAAEAEEAQEKEPNPYDDRVIPEKKPAPRAYTKSGLKKTIILLAVGSGGVYRSPMEVEELNKMRDFADDGVMLYDPYSKQGYYTRKEGKKGVIYSMKLVNNKWKKNDKIEVPLNNGEGYIGHPFVTPDGNRIYFTSTMPGGFGKSDIWYINKTGNNAWSAPINAGENINTPGVEVYPHEAGGHLFFSSDGRIGMGGLDIYVSNVTDEGPGRAVNLGAPFNSHGDDYNLTIRVDQKEGMLVSSRNLKSGDDIFRFEGFPSNLTIMGKVRDASNAAPISNVSLELFIENKSLNKVVSDQNGDFIMPASPNTTYTLRASVAGYDPAEKVFTSPADLFAPLSKLTGTDLDFELNANSSVISGKVYNIESLAPLEGAVVSLLADGKIQQTVKADLNGIYKFANLANNTKYIVRVDPKGYFFDAKEVFIANSSQNFEYSKKNGHDLDFALQRFDTNKEIVIPNLSFQTEKATILTESYESLDRIARMFIQNPQCYILLRGYVDVSIKTEVANKLSKQRVDNVRDYFISKKVNPAQILVQGMGRQNPIVRNPVKQEEHDLNNRITYTVTRVDANKELDYLTKVSTPASGAATRPSSGTAQTPSSTTNPPSANTYTPPSTPQTQTAPQTTGNDLPWRVQIAASTKLDMKQPNFATIRSKLGAEVKYALDTDGKYKYYLGGYATEREARDMANKLKGIGIKDTWVRKVLTR